MEMLKFVSWNVNGLRACVAKGFEDAVSQLCPDILAVQETKLQPEQFDTNIPSYHIYLNSAVKKGYSGTAVFTKTPPIKVSRDFELAPDMELLPQFSEEGRILTLEFDTFYFVNVYTPNSQRELTRLDFRMKWDAAFREYVRRLSNTKPVVMCGDFNVAHNEIDLKNPSTNHKNAGFTDEERGSFTELLNAGFTDTFRSLHPDTRDAYSWWSYMAKSRERNIGWRIDYFLVSNGIVGNIKSADIRPEIFGSDHCPVTLEIEV